MRYVYECKATLVRDGIRLGLLQGTCGWQEPPPFSLVSIKSRFWVRGRLLTITVLDRDAQYEFCSGHPEEKVLASNAWFVKCAASAVDQYGTYIYEDAEFLVDVPVPELREKH